MSHATGVGEPLPIHLTKRVMSLRINTVLKGCSGISVDTFERLVEFFNSGLIPYMRDQGSVGASGDLVPLAHIGLNLIGEGRCWDPMEGRYVPCDFHLLRKYGLKQADLKAKDGLALINGTQFICGVGSAAMGNAIRLIRVAHVIGAMSLVALRGHPEAFDKKIMAVRNHPGGVASAALLRKLVPVGSNIPNKDDVQDPYSLRCMPQIHGPVVEQVIHALNTIETEINSATDNPLVFSESNTMLSGGNFHGEYVAKAFDALGMYVHELGNVSYSRQMRLFNPDKNNGKLPAFLVHEAGLSSGFMTWENVSASLVSENKALSHPSSVDSMSTCADKEDHVSMGGWSARKAVKITENVGRVLAIELMGAVSALGMMEQRCLGSNVPAKSDLETLDDFYASSVRRTTHNTQAIYKQDKTPPKVEHGDDNAPPTIKKDNAKKSDGEEFVMPPLIRRVYTEIVKLFPPLVRDRYTVPESDLVYDAVMKGDVFALIEDELAGAVEDTSPKASPMSRL